MEKLFKMIIMLESSGSDRIGLRVVNIAPALGISQIVVKSLPSITM